MLSKRNKGSFTVEASFLLPMGMFLMIGVLQMGIDFYQESRAQVTPVLLEELDVVDRFYAYQILEEVGEEILGDES